jgi:Fe-S-cluster containining protein
LRVAVTGLDVARLARATGEEPMALVSFMSPDAVDMTGERESFVELAEGRRLMVLAQEHGACRLLDRDNRCRAYAARPRDCRAFPFDFGLPAERANDVVRLALLPLEGCEYDSGGEHVTAELLAIDDARWAELRSYQRLVASWNRRAFHRRRLGRTVGGRAEFLERALASAPPAAG